MSDYISFERTTIIISNGRRLYKYDFEPANDDSPPDNDVRQPSDATTTDKEGSTDR